MLDYIRRCRKSINCGHLVISSSSPRLHFLPKPAMWGLGVYLNAPGSSGWASDWTLYGRRDQWAGTGAVPKEMSHLHMGAQPSSPLSFWVLIDSAECHLLAHNCFNQLSALHAQDRPLRCLAVHPATWVKGEGATGGTNGWTQIKFPISPCNSIPSEQLTPTPVFFRTEKK